MTVQWPVMFKLTNTRQSVSTHCGVMEFSAPEGLCFLPYWVRTCVAGESPGPC